MPTERFKRLPEEKIEAIRRAGIQEFTRTSPESASINRIIQEADISRGSFYTYFESKYDLLRWLISDRVREHNDFYVQDMEENGGDIWLTLSRSLEHTIIHANDGGFMGMITKLIESKTFFDLFKESTRGERGGEPMDCKWSYLDPDLRPSGSDAVPHGSCHAHRSDGSPCHYTGDGVKEDAERRMRGRGGHGLL